MLGLGSRRCESDFKCHLKSLKAAYLELFVTCNLVSVPFAFSSFSALSWLLVSFFGKHVMFLQSIYIFCLISNVPAVHIG